MPDRALLRSLMETTCAAVPDHAPAPASPQPPDEAEPGE